MTIVIACRLLKSIIVIADCRVSYGIDAPVDDCLQKIYQLDERIVLGFSGPLFGAHQIMEAIKRNMIIYQNRPVASNLMSDLERWIRHEYKMIKQSEDRKNLSFVIASVEPKREKRSKWRTQNGVEISKPSWFPYVPDLQLIKLIPSTSNPNELVKEECGICIIGVQDEIQQAIQDRIMKLYGFNFMQPKMQALVIVNTLMYDLMKRDIISVGGLFQCAVLSKTGIEWLSYGLPSKHGDVSLEIVNGQYLQRNNVTGRVIPIMTIWQWQEEWKKNPTPGRFGVFEDPAYRKLIDRKKGKP
jgi:hypothetical protein